MSITSQIEEKLGLKIEGLSEAEKDTYLAMLDTVQKAQLTPQKLKDYVSSLRDIVAKELINEPEFNYIFIFKVFNRRQIFLKARLQNYIVLEAFLDSPNKAQEALEGMISNIK